MVEDQEHHASCQDDEALDRRHGRAAVHVAMRQQRQYLFLRRRPT